MNLARPSVLAAVLLVACQPKTSPAPPPVEVAEAEADPAEPPPVVPLSELFLPGTAEGAAVSFVEEGWVRDPDATDGPMLRFRRISDSGKAGSEFTEYVLARLPELFACYEATLEEDPDARETLSIILSSRTELDEPPVVTRTGDTPGPLSKCAYEVLQRRFPAAPDSIGSYTLDMFPDRAAAPKLRSVDLEDETAVRAGGTCWLRERYPCAPRKRCKGPTWVRSQCLPPALRTDAALRWKFGHETKKAGRHLWDRVGIELVDADGNVLWTDPLSPESAQLLGPQEVQESAEYLRDFRERGLRELLHVEMRPAEIILADTDRIWVLDRQTGKKTFEWRDEGDKQPMVWFDGGTFAIRGRGRACEGDAGGGAFVTWCHKKLWYFNGHGLAVLRPGSPWELLGETNMSKRSSKLGGTATQPRAKLEVGRSRIDIKGNVYMK